MVLYGRLALAGDVTSRIESDAMVKVCNPRLTSRFAGWNIL